MSKKKWDDPFDFDDGENPHLNHWEESLDEAVLADSHEALAKFYNKTSRRGGGSLRKMRAWD